MNPLTSTTDKEQRSWSWRISISIEQCAIRSPHEIDDVVDDVTRKQEVAERLNMITVLLYIHPPNICDAQWPCHTFFKIQNKKRSSHVQKTHTYIHSLDCQSRQRSYGEGHSLCIPSIKPSSRNLHQSIHENVDTFTSNEMKTYLERLGKAIQILGKCLVKSISCLTLGQNF